MIERIVAGFVGCAALATGAPAAAQEWPHGPVLVILAHPDDELPMAPALSRLARDGVPVRIVYATSGDAGPGVSDLEPGEALANARTGEARCASEALGLQSPVILPFGDGKLYEEARGDDSEAGLIARLQSVIDDYAPRTIITWGPDGGYGHADHRLVSAYVSDHVQAQPPQDRPLLLYFAISSDRTLPPPELSRWAQTDPALIDMRVIYNMADFEAAEAAAACHVTQFPPEVRAALAGVFDAIVWQGTVDFRAAFDLPAPE